MTSSIVQQFVLAIYRQPFVRMLLRARFGSSLFIVCYDLYKDWFEVPGNRALARRVAFGSWAIDVGANNGFFTKRFAQWVTGGGRIIAIEPDSENLALLRRRVSTEGLTAVAIHRAVAIERSGSAHLRRNPARPDDHRIADSGEIVEAITIDDLVKDAGNPTIGLIKIDTQGSERRVLAGATRTLQRCRPNLFIEVDDRALRENGTSAAQLISDIQARGYRFFTIARNGREVSVQPDEIILALASGKRDYIDVLCIPSANERGHADGATRSGE